MGSRQRSADNRNDEEPSSKHSEQHVRNARPLYVQNLLARKEWAVRIGRGERLQSIGPANLGCALDGVVGDAHSRTVDHGRRPSASNGPHGQGVDALHGAGINLQAGDVSKEQR